MNKHLKNTINHEQNSRGSFHSSSYTEQLTRDAEATIEAEKLSLFQKVQAMSIPEKIQLALKGDKEARELLIRDSNKTVSTSVMRSPKITESEVQQIAQSRNVADEVLRIISKNKEWIGKRKIKVALVNNPKTPLDVSLKILRDLRERDLSLLVRNKEIPTTLNRRARQLLDDRFKY